MAALAFGPIVSTTMAIRATENSAAGVARRWVTERDWPLAPGCSVAMCALALVLVRGSRSSRPSTQASTSGMRR